MASSLSSFLGLSAAPGAVAPPSLGAHYMIFNFLWAYVGISTRIWKIQYKIDHQVSPRQDLTKYGPKAVASGKITQAQLDQMGRVDGAHANSVEHFTLFVGTILWAHYAGLKNEDINRTALMYTIVRILYAGAYIFIGSPKLSSIRAPLWWASNIICLRLIWQAGKAVNAKGL